MGRCIAMGRGMMTINPMKDQARRNKKQQEKDDEMEKKKEQLKQDGPGESRRRKPKANKSADNISYGVGAVFAIIALVLLGLCVPHDSGASALGVNGTNASS